MTNDTVKNDSGEALPAPRLFQAPDGILDMQNLNPPDPQVENDQGDPVVVSVLVPYGGSGKIIVWFGGVSKSVDISDPKWVVQDVCFERGHLPAIGQQYNVYYEYGGSRSRNVNVKLIDSGIERIALPRHACSFFGTYAAGLVDAWVVPDSRDLKKSDPVIRQISGGCPSDGASVTILWKSGTGIFNQVGEIAFRQGAWEINFASEVLPLRRSDVFVFLVCEGNTFLNFSINI
jgi:hypothetical protein